ncbi:hypothetical protein M436DRAFT_80709 [Aureobasidium namibiae CBS 147.97]|uniref:Uncharacterized protein n=1 Tax=Aureobasidium namibiae CBS 147.97 TaxID=1043004 RepID=A0A074WRQ9_9PEZI|nr:uncharacterized protein M436DRAFT_80709 [Aureobasidium namibiae CBS 147.97]KEQ74269.1 hypothetical protein M436DRAFT_80709 [Aureobasidium namibiae CBS 147.97]
MPSRTCAILADTAEKDRYHRHHRHHRYHRALGLLPAFRSTQGQQSTDLKTTRDTIADLQKQIEQKDTALQSNRENIAKLQDQIAQNAAALGIVTTLTDASTNKDAKMSDLEQTIAKLRRNNGRNRLRDKVPGTAVLVRCEDHRVAALRLSGATALRSEFRKAARSAHVTPLLEVTTPLAYLTHFIDQLLESRELLQTYEAMKEAHADCPVNAERM